MAARTLMIMGTQSSAGKSILVTALCRAFAQQGWRVAPFKALNIALNAGVTADGHEISRATFAQAEAAGVSPHVDMNPVLIKPQGNGISQVVLNGCVFDQLRPGNWHKLQPILWDHVTVALDRLRGHNDLIIIEGAGSPAEINLKENDIVNMRVARYAQAPAVLVGDIDLGGVFAALVGTMVLLEPQERALVKGLVINKYRGDLSLLGDSLQVLQEKAFGTPVLGVIPYLPDIGVPVEDSAALEAMSSKVPDSGSENDLLDIAVIQLPSISNFDDFDPLAAESGVRVRYVRRLEELGHPSAIILPGSKTTVSDLAWLHERGFAERIVSLATHLGISVVGICGGFQMLGETVEDPQGAEAEVGAYATGLGLLPVRTTFSSVKQTVQVQATLQANVGPLAALRGLPIRGYEIHMGYSQPSVVDVPPLCYIGSSGEGRTDGALAAEGRIWGTYLHDIFTNDALRHVWLRSLSWRGEAQVFDRQRSYERLADHVRTHLDMRALHNIVWGGKA